MSLQEFTNGFLEAAKSIRKDGTIVYTSDFEQPTTTTATFTPGASGSYTIHVRTVIDATGKVDESLTIHLMENLRDRQLYALPAKSTEDGGYEFRGTVKLV